MKNSKLVFLQNIWTKNILNEGRIFLILITSMVMLVTGLLESALIGWIIDDGLIKMEYSKFVLWFSVLVVCYLIGKVSSYFNVCSLAKLHFSAEINLNMFVIKHVQKLPLSYLYGKDSVYLSSRIYQDSDAIIAYCLENFISIVFSMVAILIISFVVCVADIVLAFALIVSLICYMCIYFGLGSYIYRLFYSQKELLNKFFGQLSYLLTNCRFIKINSLENWLNYKIEISRATVMKSIVSYVKTDWLFGTGCDVVKYCFFAFYLCYSGNLVFDSRLTVGEFVILLNYVTKLFDEFKTILVFLKGWKEISVAIDRIEDILSETVDVNGKLQIEEIRNIRLNNVSFGFGESKKLLNDYSYTFERGNIYCITGVNGKGKSTLLLGLIGIILPLNGMVEYDGRNILEIDMMKTRKYKIGFSEQEPQIINGSLVDSIFSGNESRQMPYYLTEYLGDKLNSIIRGKSNENTTTLSGGEKQKISHVRIMMKNPDLLIFDEPTSALDDESRQRFIKILNVIKHDKIIIVVSHDDELVESCDVELEI